MSELLKTFARVNRAQKCPICGKDSWCLIAKDGAIAICKRVQSGQTLGDAGWRHELGNGPIKPVFVPPVRKKPGPPPNFAVLQREYESAYSYLAITMLAKDLCVSDSSLRRLAIGRDHEAWTFPMRNEHGAVVGIRRRLSNGKKLSVTGGHEGCFFPVPFPVDSPVYICEGPTDTAALLDTGVNAMGRPSCQGGRKIIEAMTRGREVVLVSDFDGPGITGAERLADELSPTRLVRLIVPLRGKDARAWRPSRAELEMCVAAMATWKPTQRAE